MTAPGQPVFVFGSQAADNAAWDEVRAAVLAGLAEVRAAVLAGQMADDLDVDGITAQVVPVLVRLADQARADGERARTAEIVARLRELDQQGARVSADWIERVW